jgi:hypothetical protein
VALSREHLLSLKRADELNVELGDRVKLLQAKHREVELLNDELRRQIAARSRELAEKLSRAENGEIVPPPVLEAGTVVENRYRVIKELGSGGMGTVYEVERVTDGKHFALKALAGGGDAQARARFAREAQIVANVNHPNVVSIVDVDVAKSGFIFLVMELVESGTTLSDVRRRNRDVPWTLGVLAQVAEGIDAIHGAGIIHRDLKPGNILLHDGVWKLADLGLARFAEAATSLNTMRGALTPPYAAPEQWRGERPTKGTDVYAFGCIMHALLHGEPPFAGPEISDYSHQHQFVAAPELKASPHLRRIAAACLAKTPEIRPLVPNLRKQLDIALAAANAGRANQLAAAGAAIRAQAALEEEQRLQQQRETVHRERLAAEAVGLLETVFKELKNAILRDAPNARFGPSYHSKLECLQLGTAMIRYGVLYPSIQRGTGSVGSRAWDILAGGYISVGTGGVPDYSRSANLWFGRLLDGDSYRWWEVSYVYPPDTSEAVYRKCEPFGDDHETFKYSRCLSALVAMDPLPVTPEFVDEFIERWIELFAQTAPAKWENHPAMRRMFPATFPRKKVSSNFKLDRK